MEDAGGGLAEDGGVLGGGQRRLDSYEMHLWSSPLFYLWLITTVTMVS